MQHLTDCLLHPSLPLLGEDVIQIAFKQLTGVGEVLLGIGDRRRDPCKRFIENGDNALLFGEGGEGNLNLETFLLVDISPD